LQTPPSHPQLARSLTHCSDRALAARSDEQLVAQLRQGRDRAFEILAARYQTRLLWFCWKLLQSKEDAEDALQDVFASAFRALLADDREVHVRPWLYQIARNRCINELRRARMVRFDALDEEQPETGHSMAEGVASRQQLRDLVDDVQALPDMQCTALLLREIDGFAYEQIATAMGTTVPGVKSLLFRARAGLRDSATAREASLAPAAPATTCERQRSRAHRSARTASYQTARAAANVFAMPEAHAHASGAAAPRRLTRSAAGH
jgi:RNA polymerase sigma factor (sigma-70 family)